MLRWLMWLFGIALLAWGVLIASSFLLFIPILTPSSTYTSNLSNVQFKVPGGWQQTESVSQYLKGYGVPDAEFVHVGGGDYCFISHFKTYPSRLKSNRQAVLVDNILSDHANFSGGWKVSSTSDYALPKSGGSLGRPPSGAMLVMYSLAHGVFVLSTVNTGSVSDACVNDLTSLLKTVETYYEEVVLTASSTGSISYKVIDSQSNGKPTFSVLTFTDDATLETRAVMKFNGGFYFVPEFSVVGDTLYAINRPYIAGYNSSIWALEPFAGSYVPIKSSLANGAYMSSLYVQGDNAYYLMGTSSLGYCLDTPKPCPASLFSISLKGGEPQLVATTSIGGKINGYDEREGAWHIAQGWGDAGFIQTRYRKVVNGNEVMVGDYSGDYSCESVDEPHCTDGIAKY